ncbi:MBL fold metallo-hydrolase [Candidatus Dojkabacteria bacterium]|uniref:MBL fold metallo-hydrolase n=1 Tax=Candidatus Dojkabacteria bacterium TaxID=2099670 RepID=A0A955L8X5_9BACT|nr:MBL fold metallo-hydrolase [Candidatus Dojkabacteria bacterium]
MLKNFELKFCGAAKTVTGSCYEITADKRKILIDCGMFQGEDVFKLNYEEFKFIPKEIEAVVLTHGHIDHCGLLPKLYKEGFRGKVYCTPPTAEILRYILLDSARVQEKNFQFKHIEPLYNVDDSIGLLSLLETKDFNTSFELDSFEIELIPSSHILGAASVSFKYSGKHLLFSGDIGRIKPRIIKGFEDDFLEPDTIIMESLYGNRLHPDFEQGVSKLSHIINETTSRNGNVIIPIFSLHRSQEILFILNSLIKEGRLDPNVQLFFDTPLGENLLNVYLENSKYFSSDFNSLDDPFGLENPNLSIVRSGGKSRRLKKEQGAIIIAGGGMADGGRVVGHIASFIHDTNSSIIFTGFQAEGTLGHELIKHPNEVTINKQKRKVKFKIHEVYGFSAHADSNELLWWLESHTSDNLKEVFLVHADLEQSSDFSELIKGKGYTNITIPELGQTVDF